MENDVICDSLFSSSQTKRLTIYWGLKLVTLPITSYPDNSCYFPKSTYISVRVLLHEFVKLLQNYEKVVTLSRICRIELANK